MKRAVQSHIEKFIRSESVSEYSLEDLENAIMESDNEISEIVPVKKSMKHLT